VDPYSEIAEHYDREHDALEDDIAFYLQSADVVGDPILELGCGTGRIAVALAEAGHRVTGLDRSPAMLALARARAAAAGVDSRVEWVRAEMTAADGAPGGPFGLVIVALNGLLHVDSAAGQRRVLESVWHALDPRGQLLVDVLNPTAGWLGALDGRVEHEGTWTATSGQRVDKFSARHHQPAEQRVLSEIWYDERMADGTVRRRATSFTLRYLTRAELELMLEMSGFPMWQVYGGYDLEPYVDDSSRILIAAERTAP
jgi:SAM-dependent methyltransferase